MRGDLRHATPLWLWTAWVLKGLPARKWGPLPNAAPRGSEEGEGGRWIVLAWHVGLWCSETARRKVPQQLDGWTWSLGLVQEVWAEAVRPETLAVIRRGCVESKAQSPSAQGPGCGPARDQCPLAVQSHCSAATLSPGLRLHTCCTSSLQGPSSTTSTF